MLNILAEVLDNDLYVLRDVSWMQACCLSDHFSRLALRHDFAADGRILLRKAIRKRIRRVVLQNVANKALLNGLLHHVRVKWMLLTTRPRRAENVNGLRFWRRREREITYVLRVGAFCHARCEHVLSID